MEHYPDTSTESLDPIAAEALSWVIRRMDDTSWSKADEETLRRWRALSPANEREFVRHQTVAQWMSQPQAHRESASQSSIRPTSPPSASSDRVEPSARQHQAAEAFEYFARANRSETKTTEAVTWLDEAVKRLQSLLVDGDSQYRLTLARALVRRGDARRRLSVRQHLDAILKDYDDAEYQLLLLLPDQKPSWRQDLAEVCTQRGVALLHLATPQSLQQAVTCFDRAIEFRQSVRPADNPWNRYGLMAAWMNRGDALHRLGGQTHAALAAYDQAFQLFHGLPLAEHPLFTRRFLVACLNRCAILLDRNGPGDPTAALRDCDAALSRMPASSDETSQEKTLRASIWASRAAACARLATVDSSLDARQASHHALSLIKTVEREDAQAADAGLIARHALCAAVARLVTSNVDSALRENLVSEVMAAINEGLDLARSWERRGPLRYHEQVTEIFRFGARLTEQYQPHQLGRFFLSQIDARYTSDRQAWRPEFHAFAIHALETSMERLLKERIRRDATAEISDYFLDALNAMSRDLALLRESR